MAGASPHFLLQQCCRRAVYYTRTNPSRPRGGGSAAGVGRDYGRGGRSERGVRTNDTRA